MTGGDADGDNNFKFNSDPAARARRYYGVSRIKASRDIDVGEELCFPYITLLKPR